MSTEAILSIVIVSVNLVIVICILEALFRTARAVEALVRYEKTKHPGIDQKTEVAQWEITLSQRVKELLAKKKFVAVAPNLIREKAIMELKHEGLIPPQNWGYDLN